MFATEEVSQLEPLYLEAYKESVIYTAQYQERICVMKYDSRTGRAYELYSTKIQENEVVVVKTNYVAQVLYLVFKDTQHIFRLHEFKGISVKYSLNFEIHHLTASDGLVGVRGANKEDVCYLKHARFNGSGRIVTRCFESHRRPRASSCFDIYHDLKKSLLACNDIDDEVGDVHIELSNDLKEFKPCYSFLAHGRPVDHIAFNGDGTLLATGSTKGGTVKVFEITPTGAKHLHSFRGIFSAFKQNISRLHFCSDNKYLTMCSSTSTAVYVFSLTQKAEEEAALRASRGIFGSFIASCTKFLLPTYIKEESEFATANIGDIGHGNDHAVLVCAKNMKKLVIINKSGSFIFLLNEERRLFEYNAETYDATQKKIMKNSRLLEVYQM